MLSVLGKTVLFVNSFQMANELFEKRSINYSDRSESVMSGELYVLSRTSLQIYSCFFEAWAGTSVSAICATVSRIIQKKPISLNLSKASVGKLIVACSIVNFNSLWLPSTGRPKDGKLMHCFAESFRLRMNSFITYASK